MYSFRGENKDGIEVYETSEEIKKLPYTERQQRFFDIMKNEYRGRTAKFVRNGHAYYATFEEGDVNKNIYGDKRSDPKGWKAKINVGADGNIFELVENARYNGSKPEKSKKIAAHRGVGFWDYFIKNVQIDDTVYDLVANVRKKADGAYVYSIQLNQNKTIEASPPRGSLLRALSGVPNASKDTASSDWLTQRVTSAAEKTAGQKGVVFKDNVAQNNIEVNKKFSMHEPAMERANKVLKRENERLKADGRELSFEDAFEEALADASENFRRTEKNTADGGGDVKNSVGDGKLSADSTEQERYELLRNATVRIAEVNAEAIRDVDLAEYNTRKKSAVVPGLKNLARKLGVLNVDLENSGISFPFKFSSKNLEVSLHHQLEYGGTYQVYVKAMSCFNELVKNAVPIEVHTEKRLGLQRPTLI